MNGTGSSKVGQVDSGPMAALSVYENPVVGMEPSCPMADSWQAPSLHDDLPERHCVRTTNLFPEAWSGASPLRRSELVSRRVQFIPRLLKHQRDL